MNPVRKRLSVVLFCWTILYLTINQAAWAKEMQAGIYFDGSGSMQGFFSNNGASIRDINARLYAVLSAIHVQRTTSSVFVSTGVDTRMIALDDHLRNPTWGSDTRLDTAFEYARDMDIAMIVSDNVQDTGAYGTSSTTNFYQMLEADNVGTVLLIPLRFTFNGPLYFYKNRHPDLDNLVRALIQENPQAHITGSRQGHVYQRVTYQGEKALILYTIFKNGFPLDHLKTFTKRLEDGFGVLPLMVKPVDQGNFLLEGVLTKSEVIQSFNSFEALCGPGDGNQNIAAPRPNLVLESPRLDFFRAGASDGGQRYQLLPERNHEKTYPTDSLKIMRFYTRLVNRSSTTVLGPPGEFEPCSDKIRMELKDVTFDIPSRWQSCFIRPGSVVASVRPDYIPRLLNQDATEDDNRQNAAFVTKIRLEIPRLKPHLKFTSPFESIANMVQLAFCRHIPMSVKGTLAINVPPGHFSVDSIYDKKYFTRSVYDQQRLYSPEDIVAYINISTTTLEYDFLSKELVMVPPTWIKVAVFVTIGLLMLFGLLTGVSLTRTVCLRFDDRSDVALRVALPRPFETREYVHNGSTILRVKKQFINYHAYPGEGFHFTDMEDAVLAMAHLKPGDAFQISGPGMMNVIVEIGSCAKVPAGCELVDLTVIGASDSKNSPTDNGDDFDDGSELTVSKDKGEA